MGENFTWIRCVYIYIFTMRSTTHFVLSFLVCMRHASASYYDQYEYTQDAYPAAFPFDSATVTPLKSTGFLDEVMGETRARGADECIGQGDRFYEDGGFMEQLSVCDPWLQTTGFTNMGAPLEASQPNFGSPGDAGQAMLFNYASFLRCSGYSYMFAWQFGMFFLCMPTMNCSATVAADPTMVRGAHHWTGTFGKHEGICEEGSCCKDFWGMDSYDHSPVMYLTITANVNDVLLCPKPQEQTYCLLTNVISHLWCASRFNGELTGNHLAGKLCECGPSVRDTILPCYDNVYRHFISCEGWEMGGASESLINYDTEKYVSSLTTNELASGFAITFQPDHVCHPYAYYNPNDGGNDSSAGVFGISAILAIGLAMM